jgi:DNA modification methylase
MRDMAHVSEERDVTELVWDGKYAADGKSVSPLRIALPFQTIETVNESAQERQLTLESLFRGGSSGWRNRLIWGDKKYVLPSLLPEFAGKVDLIYIDPPFDTGADFSFNRTIPESGGSFSKEPSIIEQKAYRDTWGRGLDGYLQWFYDTALLLCELLADSGSIYIHIGTNVSHYLKSVLDEIFGMDRFVNEIAWKRQAAHSDSKQGSRHYGRLHDSILIYTKSDGYTWNQLYQPYDETYVSTFYANVDSTGRRFQYGDLTGPGGAAKGNPIYEFLGVTRAWRYSRQKMEELYQQGRIEFRPGGKVPRLKRYLDEAPGMPVQDVWTDVSYGALINFGNENVGYPTQKPEALLDRIIKASSNEGNLVLDCFCGSGTTAVVAEKFGRRWIACDLGRFAIQTTRKRLLSLPDVRPFVVQNLGKYERQAWQAAEFAQPDQEAHLHARYRRFILDLYHAEPLEGYTWLHGLKNGRYVHIGAVDAPSRSKIPKPWHANAGRRAAAMPATPPMRPMYSAGTSPSTCTRRRQR